METFLQSIIGITLKDESNNVVGVKITTAIKRLCCGTVSGFKAKHNETKIPMTTKFTSAH